MWNTTFKTSGKVGEQEISENNNFAYYLPTYAKSWIE